MKRINCDTWDADGLKDLIGRRGRAKGLMVPSGSVMIAAPVLPAASAAAPPRGAPLPAALPVPLRNP
jgi:hypothetical protein